MSDPIKDDVSDNDEELFKSIPIEELPEISRRVRRDILRMIHEAGSGHPGGSLSAVDILTALYFNIMKHKPGNVRWPNRDRFVLSKGHSAPALYSAMAHTGYLKECELLTLRRIGSRLQGHPSMRLLPGIDMSTGSLGQGLSVTNGIALGGHLNRMDYRVFTLLGDGECQSGQVWEAAMASAYYTGKGRMNKIIAFLDRNHYQIDGDTEDVMGLEPLEKKFSSFGWHTQSINGHDFGQIISAVDVAGDVNDKPSIIIAETTKGKGVDRMEREPVNWHGNAPKTEECKEFLECVEDTSYFPGERERLLAEGKKELENICTEPGCVPSESDSGSEKVNLVEWHDNFEWKNNRKAYGLTLKGLGGIEEGKDMVVLDADLSHSTNTYRFQEDFPDRFFNMGIAEQNMMATAAGLATTGKKVFASTFAIFATGRVYDQIRQSIAYPALNVKIVATHGGISVGGDGASHQMNEDIALMRTLPNMRVIVPADYRETEEVIKYALGVEGPAYIRLGRSDTPVIFDADYRFELGKATMVCQGTDATVIVIGQMVPRAIEASHKLAKEGLKVRVLNMSTVKPIDRHSIVKAARETGAIVTAEEHSYINGLGSAVAEVLGENYPVPLERIGIPDIFGQSGESEELMIEFKLTTTHIIESVHRVIERKNR